MEDWQIDYDFCLKLENWETYILHVLTNQISVNTPPPPNTSHTKFHPKCLRVKFYQAFKNNAMKLKFVCRYLLFILFFFYWANRWWCNAVRATHEWWCNTPDSKGVLCLHTTLRTAEHMLNYCHCHWYFRQTDK